MRHPSIARMCARYSGRWISKSSPFLYSRRSRPTMAPRSTVDCSHPVVGIPEDPGTGSACGPLGAYLLKYKAVSAKIASRLVSLQGVRMGRPSCIHIALSSRAEFSKRFRSAARRWSSARERSAHSRLLALCRTCDRLCGARAGWAQRLAHICGVNPSRPRPDARGC